MKPKMVGWLPSGRENGPATRAHSTRSAACEGRRCVRLLRHMSEEGRHAAPKVRVLIVLAVVLHFISHAHMSSCDSLGLRTRNERAPLKDMKDMLIEGYAVSRSGAHWAGLRHYAQGRPASPLCCPRAPPSPRPPVEMLFSKAQLSAAATSLQ